MTLDPTDEAPATPVPEAPPSRPAQRIRGSCAVCKHAERQRIEALRAGGVGIDRLARRFKVTRDAVWRHFKQHVSAETKLNYLAGEATVAELRERAASERQSVLDYLQITRSILVGAMTQAAEDKERYAVANLSGRLLDVLRELGRITGEVERLTPTVSITNTIAFASDPRMIELQSGLLHVARAHPEARPALVALLRRLDGPVGSPVRPTPPTIDLEASRVG